MLLNLSTLTPLRPFNALLIPLTFELFLVVHLDNSYLLDLKSLLTFMTLYARYAIWTFTPFDLHTFRPLHLFRPFHISTFTFDLFLAINDLSFNTSFHLFATHKSCWGSAIWFLFLVLNMLSIVFVVILFGLWRHVSNSEACRLPAWAEMAEAYRAFYHLWLLLWRETMVRRLSKVGWPERSQIVDTVSNGQGEDYNYDYAIIYIMRKVLHCSNKFSNASLWGFLLVVSTSRFQTIPFLESLEDLLEPLLITWTRFIQG